MSSRNFVVLYFPQYRKIHRKFRLFYCYNLLPMDNILAQKELDSWNRSLVNDLGEYLVGFSPNEVDLKSIDLFKSRLCQLLSRCHPNLTEIGNDRSRSDWDIAYAQFVDVMGFVPHSAEFWWRVPQDEEILTENQWKVK
ncbi:unnamed protein product [Adineta ricciae]|uniref:Uncharacterized protein n=1 Tax=Adineta ricciae TaxID=249248 RepID=A0A816DGX4_ADIRI|nr:unnamed protein product [Adineta ricciae]CAF1638239.1 unnamed protein product [Adineta ricciae]